MEENKTDENVKVFIGGESDFFDKLDDTSRAEFLGQCASIFGNRAFKKIYEFLISDAVVWMAREARDMDQLSVGRGTINGLDLFYERMRKYALEYEEMKSGEEDFDRHKIISE